MAVPPGGEFSRRSGFGWSLGAVTRAEGLRPCVTEHGTGLELEASLCCLDSCRLVSEEQT